MAHVVLAVLALASVPGLASQTACTFEGEKARQYYELEFIGDNDAHPMIVFSSTAFNSGQRVPLQPETYRLGSFSRKAATVRLEFHNPGLRSLPPSFRLAGHGGRARLQIGPTAIDGSLKCGD